MDEKEIKIRKEREDQFFDQCVPNRYKNASLENSKQNNQIIDYARNWAIKPKSLLIIGSYGTGKTYLSFAMLREFFRKFYEYNPYYTDFPLYFSSVTLDAQLLSTQKSEKGDRQLMKNLTERNSVLFIDDVGREMKTDRFKRQYYEIINERYSNCLPTIVTSNFNLDEISEIIDPAVASRMQEWDCLKLHGEDLRQKK